MTDYLGERLEDSSKDWRKYAIPAMGSVILILLGVVLSLVTLDRSGIKKEICDLRSDLKIYQEKMEGTTARLEARNHEVRTELRELQMLVRVPFTDRAKILWGPNGRPNHDIKGR